MINCEAPPTSCGTPSGWRVGGRCYNCRRAHNADTAVQRGYGLTADQREAAIAAALDGRDVRDVAVAAGCSIRVLMRAADSDPELDAVLSGGGRDAQYLARYGSYLMALVVHDGSVTDAAADIGMSKTSVYKARHSDTGFAAAERSVREWVESATTQSRGRITGPMLDRATEVLRETGSVSAAATAIGVNPNALYYRAQRDPDSEFGRAWATDRKTHKGSKSRTIDNGEGQS